MTARILVVDDSGESVRLLQRKLTSEYLEVVTAVDGAEALAKIAECNPDIVLLDAVMPGLDGFEVCRRLKAAPATTHLPVVMITALDQPADRVSALDAGADEFVSKPFEPLAFMALVRSLIRRKDVIDELRLSEQAGHDVGLESTDEPTLSGEVVAALVAQNVERDRPVSVMIVDIDHFKKVNDTCGHEAGDEVLREVAHRMSASLRGLDLCCRFGGEEFVAAFSGGGAEMALAIAERLRQSIAGEPVAIAARPPLAVTISIGIATTTGPGDTAEALQKRADAALYRAKAEGRNRVGVAPG